jgi:hypothetical protein
MAEYNDISKLYPKTKVGTKTILDVWNAFTITEEFKNNTVVFANYHVEEFDTWSSIAGKVYGDRRLWWVIALYNNIEDPFQLYYEFGINNKTTNLKVISEIYIYSLLNEITNRLKTIDYESLDL